MQQLSKLLEATAIIQHLYICFFYQSFAFYILTNKDV